MLVWNSYSVLHVVEIARQTVSLEQAEFSSVTKELMDMLVEIMQISGQK